MTGASVFTGTVFDSVVFDSVVLTGIIRLATSVSGPEAVGVPCHDCGCWYCVG